MELNHLGDEAAWARQDFGLVDLGDERRTDRLSFIAHAWALQPGLHLPSLFARLYDVKAAFALSRLLLHRKIPIIALVGYGFAANFRLLGVMGLAMAHARGGELSGKGSSADAKSKTLRVRCRLGRAIVMAP
jgi:hypothetical protein